MPGIIVRAAGDGPQAAARELRPGGQLTFGRGSADQPVDLAFDEPGVSRLAGRIRAVDDHWLISNLSRATAYVVENPEGDGEFVRVPPRRLRMPVPFEFSRVLLPAETGPVSFLVFAPGQMFADPDAPDPDVSGTTVVPFPLDVTATYFLVLVALCEPRLRDGPGAAVPSVPEIIRRLAAVPGCGGLTRSAVAFHIDYLASVKLRVPEPAAGRAAKADWQRAALVSLALRFDLVRQEHLALLSR
ncbi:winged helix-turn-helix domain-containing protein [Actinomadura fibrosa]|uniref:Winged helix-turn-helix domain-containing protein n=1 Tax=Actinomadura fibrosa TaxID=111802 RepID=A0ABW2XKA9_9ACTN|nr:winged helix-turn-helix domain-containing protein [Actinomadura fibrosa]